MTCDRLTDRATIVTGAASGIGRGTALRLVSEGAQVLASDVNAEGLAETEALAADVADHGGKLITRVADISDEASANETVATAVEAFGKLDGIANIAGMLRSGRTHEFDLELWERILRVNLTGTFLMCKAALKWVDADWGHASHGIRHPFAPDPELFMFHFKFADVGQLELLAEHRHQAAVVEGRAVKSSWSRPTDEIVEALRTAAAQVEQAVAADELGRFRPGPKKLEVIVQNEGDLWRATGAGQHLALGARDVPGARVEVAAHLRDGDEVELDADPLGGVAQELDVEPGTGGVAGDERRIGVRHAGGDAPEASCAQVRSWLLRMARPSWTRSLREVPVCLRKARALSAAFGRRVTIELRSSVEMNSVSITRCGAPSRAVVTTVSNTVAFV